MKYIRKLEEKVTKYKMIIKGAQKRKYEESGLPGKEPKIPRLMEEELLNSSSTSPQKDNILELVERVKEWTEKASNNVKSTSTKDVEEIPLPPNNRPYKNSYRRGV